MALTFTERVDERIGRKKFKIYEVTHDGSTTTLDATSMELHYIDYALVLNKGGVSAVGDISYLSGNAYGAYVTFANALSASAVDVVQVIGW